MDRVRHIALRIGSMLHPAQVSHCKNRHVKLTVGNCAIVGGQSVGLPSHLSWQWRLCGIPFRVGIAQPIGCNLEGERIAIDRSGRIVCAQVPRRRSIGQRPGDGTDHPRPTQLSNEGRRATGDGDGARGFTLEDRQCTAKYSMYIMGTGARQEICMGSKEAKARWPFPSGGTYGYRQGVRVRRK